MSTIIDYSKIHCPDDKTSQDTMTCWGKKKLERYAELVIIGHCTEEAFEIVEYNKGLVDED